MIEYNRVSFWIFFLGSFATTFLLPGDFLVFQARQLDSFFFVPEAADADLEYSSINVFLWQLIASYFLSVVLFVTADIRGWDEKKIKPVRDFRKGYYQRYRQKYILGRATDCEWSRKYSTLDGWGEKIGFRYAQVVCPIGNAIGLGILGTLLIATFFVLVLLFGGTFYYLTTMFTDWIWA